MAEVSTPEFHQLYPRSIATPFRAIDGFIDFLLPSISVGSSGAISGLPNIAPSRMELPSNRHKKSCVKLWNLSQEADSAKEAAELQQLIALADGVALKIGVSRAYIRSQLLHFLSV
ncbi:uncharacterized protein N7459_005928 [Penicillium hispanicum]|uniref:uncharacterized protein n=1 Tax=Penicillium hispanicum TaxID=1080232 RepID=UPI00254268EA|nr:uncharacterized protein N7459_005928 [Penicillium hispanicum]KAJ5579943.1 hypothetical protein N7459_005928 [Penicillium hispanicum]